MSHHEDIKAVLERYDYILFLLQQHKDEIGLSLLTKLVEDCRKYVEFVARRELNATVKAFHKEGVDVAEEVERMDAIKTRYHNAAIDAIYILNRYLFKVYDAQIPLGGIFSLDYNLLRRPRERLTIEQRSDFAVWIELFVEALSKR